MTKTKMAVVAVTLVVLGLVGLIIRKEHRPGQQPGHAPVPITREQDRAAVLEQQPYHFTRQQSLFFTERLDFGKRLGLALLTIAKENGGRLPPDLTSAASWLATNAVPISGDVLPNEKVGIGAADFELVYTGNLSHLTNRSQTILARERNPVEIHEGRWNRMYVFADGSVNRLEATTADGFPARENEVWPNQPP